MKLDSLLRGISSSSSLSSHPAVPGSEPLLITKAPPCVRVSQPEWILVKRSIGRLALLTMRCHPLSFDLQGAFLCTYNWEVLLDFEKEGHVVFYLSSGQGSSLSLLLFWSICP